MNSLRLNFAKELYLIIAVGCGLSDFSRPTFLLTVVRFLSSGLCQAFDGLAQSLVGTVWHMRFTWETRFLSAWESHLCSQNAQLRHSRDQGLLHLRKY